MIHHLTGTLDTGIGGIGAYGLDTPKIIIDTSSATLWQIGNTLKPIFSNHTITTRGVMTDTLNTYPPNANDFFVLEVDYIVPNFIVDVWHKYQTDSLHAGGIVEFSFDSGSTWMNVVDCPEIVTQNYYLQTDTIVSGQPGFTGNSNEERLSRLQFMNCSRGGQKTTTGCTSLFDLFTPIYLRFRFESDSTIDSLSGWMIDSIRIENPGCVILGGGYVPAVSNSNSLNLFPNPATTEITITSTDKIGSIAISNLLGQTVFTHEYDKEEVQVDVSDFPAGMYFVKVNGSEVRKFMKN